MDFDGILHFAVEHNASDVHIQAGLPATFRIGGVLRQAALPPTTDEQVRNFIKSIAPLRFQDNFDDRLITGMDFSHAIPGFARFRCSAYSNLSTAGIVMRIIKGRIPSLEELHLPSVIAQIAMAHHGLTLVTGTTGSGKSTTLASMLQLINNGPPTKIIAIEDPVEYMHTPHHALIAQLEVGTDTPSFEQALRQALRQDPDVILVGELRDMDTLRIALRAADTGHAVFSTVHSASAPQTIERIIAMFPPAEHKLLLTQLAGNLHAIISQRLLICRDGTRRPAVEIMLGGPVPTRWILEGRALELHDYMRSAGGGQQTFDQHLVELFKQELITHQEAIANATNREALNTALRGIKPPKPGEPGYEAHEKEGRHIPRPPAKMPPIGEPQRH